MLIETHKYLNMIRLLILVTKLRFWEFGIFGDIICCNVCVKNGILKSWFQQSAKSKMTTSGRVLSLGASWAWARSWQTPAWPLMELRKSLQVNECLTSVPKQPLLKLKFVAGDDDHEVAIVENTFFNFEPRLFLGCAKMVTQSETDARHWCVVAGRFWLKTATNVS